jgi:hypothetical protein
MCRAFKTFRVGNGAAKTSLAQRMRAIGDATAIRQAKAGFLERVK